MPLGWDADAAIGSCLVVRGWRGGAWRFHKRRYGAIDHRGSLTTTDRYNRATDLFPPDQTRPVLYLALDRAVSIGEIQRHLSPAFLPALIDYRLTTMRVDLVGSVVLCDDPARLGLGLDDLCHDTDWAAPQRLAAAAVVRGVEAMVVPSATRLGDNLVVFPLLLQPGSTILETGSVDPRLYVDRSAGPPSARGR